MTHPILACAVSVREQLKGVADANPTFLSPAEKAQALRELTAATAQLAELRLRVLAVAGDLAVDTGAHDPGAWLAAQTRLDARTTRADWRTAQELDQWPLVRRGLAEGAFSPDHARIATRALTELADLPTELGLSPETLTAAEAELTRLAALHTPTELRRLATHLLDVIAPEIAEEAEARRLADQEKAAAHRTRLTLKPQGDGTTRISGLVPDAIGERLHTTLEAFAQPRRAALAADGQAHPRPRLLGDALGQLLETLDPTRLPLHGGDATTITVTISLETLRTQLGTGLLEDQPLSATQIRRLACTARIIPAVLDSHGHLLDLGRAKRLFTPAQRKALRLRDHHCRAEGCTIPARWCDAHHQRPWTTGGTTNLDNGILLCGHHHHRAHDPAYTTHRLPNGDYRFTRRT